MSLLADDRQPAEAVLDAIRRHEPKRLAAFDDPWTLDRALRAERKDHAAVITGRPPDYRPDVQRARDAVARAERAYDEARRGVARSRDALHGLGPLTRLRRGGRDEIARAEQGLQRAQVRLGKADWAVEDARAEFARIETAVAARAKWDQLHGWREGRVAEIDDTLAHHWAAATLRAVRADDPLAFGIDRLRHARHTYGHDLERITAGLPPDRSEHLTRAETDLRHHETNLGHCQGLVRRAQGELDEALRRRWGRRDRPSIDRAEADLAAAGADLRAAAQAVAHDKARVRKEDAAVRAYQAALDQTSAERSHLRSALDDIDRALIDTVAQSVVTAVEDRTRELSSALGDPVADLVDRSRQLIAQDIDTDDVVNPRPLDGPARWRAMLEVIDREARVEPLQRHLEHDYGIEL